MWDKAPEDEIVVKANELVTAQIDWTVWDYRVFIAHVAQIKRDDDCFKPQSIQVKRLGAMCGLDNAENLYHRCKGIASRLTKISIDIERGQKGSRTAGGISVYSKCVYKEKQGVIVGQFTDHMQPYLLEIKDRFTRYMKRRALSLGSIYSIRFYEILRRYDHTGRFRLSVDEIRDIFNLHDKYQRFTDLKRRVIDRAQEEIARETDVEFDYDVLRDGRSPVAVDFMIDSEEITPDVPGPSTREEPSNGSGSNDKGSTNGEGDKADDPLQDLTREEEKTLRAEAKEKAKTLHPDAGDRYIQAETERILRNMADDSN